MITKALFFFLHFLSLFYFSKHAPTLLCEKWQSQQKRLSHCQGYDKRRRKEAKLGQQSQISGKPFMQSFVHCVQYYTSMASNERARWTKLV